MIIKVIEKTYINNKNDIVDNYRLKTENDSCTKVAIYISLTPTKQVFLRISQNSQENTGTGVSF